MVRGGWDCSNNIFGRTLVTHLAGTRVVQVCGRKGDGFYNFKGDNSLAFLGILDRKLSIKEHRCSEMLL